jgi:ATP-dependent HslUV protease ATP-binding subunit HslU
MRFGSSTTGGDKDDKDKSKTTAATTDDSKKKDDTTTATPAPGATPATPAGDAESAKVSIRDMTPRQLMTELDKYIVGQKDAKRAVSVALRNRWRRHQVPEELREEINPKNILMIGPTGVGKTEISRRLAKLTDAPFVKVEATKFTEVGFHGRDVDTIIEDLYKVSLNQTKSVLMRRFEEQARQKAEDRILQALAGAAGGFREHLRTGGLDNIEVTLDIQEKKEGPKQTVGGGGEGFVSMDLSSLMGFGGAKRPRMIKKTLRIKEALPIVLAEEQEKLVETADLHKEALRACEEDGIVVIDEIDKIVTPSSGYKGHQASAEGVQQDLLPLIEGTTVQCKNNVQVKTDKILFICSGAFHSVKPSDMLAELQGRLPIRVELKALTKEDFHRILTEPKYNLLKQHIAMMKTEGVELQITDDAIWELASVAAHVNSLLQNIGARRLITVTEKVLEEISFEGPEKKGQTVVVDKAYVQKMVAPMLKKDDLSKYLL